MVDTLAAVVVALIALFESSTAQSASSVIRRVGPSAIPLEQQTYGFQKEARCRIFSHQSAVLKNKDHHALVFDGGIAKFKTRLNSEQVEVLDLNGFTGWIDLSKPFIVSDFPIETHKRIASDGVPVLSRFGLWDDGQDCVFVNGGHFFDADKWNSSRYFLPKENLPPYNIWRFCLSTRSWTKVYEDTQTNRTLGGSFVSIPGQDTNYYLGGLRSPRSAKETPLNVSYPSPNMLVFNHKTNSLTSEKYYSPSENYGYWHGQLIHLPIGTGKGFLISLSAERGLLNNPIVDLPYTSDETGEEVLFTNVLLWDIDRRTWANQSTSFINEKPEARTRFCSVLVRGQNYNTWDLWIFGGQRLIDGGLPTDDLWVLSMPSFVWSRISVPQSGFPVTTRSPTCNAVGQQLLIFGGYPPGAVVLENATCDSEYLKIFDMSDPGWKSSYKINTVYNTPDQVVQRVELGSAERRRPYQNPWSSTRLQEAFDYDLSLRKPPTKGTSKSGGLSAGAKAGVAVGAVIFGVLVAAVIALVIRRRRQNRQPQPGAAPPGQWRGDHGF
ncbi:MAG: hypothetical protein M1814_002279 [Vezdaea aestivalis]|nr:MAG: hypothetical protein M1814_002279 [Vezdaea aestivalis]